MPVKPQHSRRYRRVPGFLREMRETAGLTQRALAKLLTEPQSFVYKCETGIRRLDVAEFCDWAAACGIAPSAAIKRFFGKKGD